MISKKIKILLFIVFLLPFPEGAFFAATDNPIFPINDAKFIQAETSNEFTFVIFGDFRTLRRDRPYLPVFKHILNEVNTIAPSFVISTGDAYYGYGGSFQRFKNEVDYFLSMIKPLSIPFFNVIGNHETGGEVQRESYIKERFKKLYGSFDFGNSHFILLDTDETGKEGTISGEQLKWLRSDLEVNINAENIFIFMHRPLFPVLDPELIHGKSFKDKENRDSLHSLFTKNKVRAVFAGHEHLYNDFSKDGVRYVITGGGGSPLYETPQKGGFFHYLLLEVKGKDITINVLPPQSLQVRTISGNDGFESKTEIEVISISSVDINVRNLLFTMPAAGEESYKVGAVSISPIGHKKEHNARIRAIKDNRDGTSSISVEAMIPRHGVVRITVEGDI